MLKNDQKSSEKSEKLVRTFEYFVFWLVIMKWCCLKVFDNIVVEGPPLMFFPSCWPKWLFNGLLQTMRCGSSMAVYVFLHAICNLWWVFRWRKVDYTNLNWRFGVKSLLPGRSSVFWPITLRVFVVAKIGVFVHILLFVLILGKLENLVVNQPSSVTLSRRCRTRTKNGWIGNQTQHFPDLQLSLAYAYEATFCSKVNLKFLWSGFLLQRYVFFAFSLMFCTKAPSYGN